VIGKIDWLGQIVGAVPDGDVSWNGKVARALIRQGLAVVIIEPNGKKAVCTLNTREKKAADKAAQDAAREAGSPNWDRVRHDCGIKHAITDEKYLTRTRIKSLLADGANLAVALGAGERRIMIVDVDTEEEKRAFLEDWQGDGAPETLTVTSPGTMNTAVEGEPIWVHKNGGHFWFDVPDDEELPESPGKLTWCRCHGSRQPAGGCRNAWAAYYGSGYVLVPPSFRPEGAYRLTGAVHPAPEWLTALIRDARTDDRSERADGALSALDLPDDPIDRWSAETSWFSILTEDGFTPHDHDACGCPTFTRPGDATHSKSVTAHEFGCTKYDTTNGHGPLRIWSDALGSGTMSKLTYMAKFHHNGDTGAAMRSLGIDAMHADDGDELFSLGEIPKGTAPRSLNGENGAASQVENDDRFAPIDWDELFAQDFTKADHLPGQLLEAGQQIAIIGDGKSGKSLIMADWCVNAIQGKPFLTENTCEPLVIMYLDAENSRRDLGMRMISLGANPAMLNGMLIYLSFPPFKPLDSDDGAKQVMKLVQKYRPNVVILDTVSRFIQGKENDSDTWLALYRLLHRRLKAAGVAGIRLDHFGKDAEKGGRGSSAKSQDIDHVWELTVQEEDQRQKGNAIEVTTLLSLKRTHTRTGLGMDFMRVERTGLKTEDEWLPGETRHVLADAFDGGLTELPEVKTRPTAVMRQVCDALRGTENGMPLRQIRDAISAKGATVDYAIELLIENGNITRERIGRANVHKLVKEFEDGEE
jgi:hypothetical protein